MRSETRDVRSKIRGELDFFNDYTLPGMERIPRSERELSSVEMIGEEYE